MTIIARVTPIWKKQKLFVGVFLLAFTAWFCWDGAVGFPRTNERYNRWREFRDTGKLDEWPAYAKSRGWKTQPPDHGYTDMQVRGQYLWASLTGVSSLLVLIYWLQQIRRTLQCDDEAVTTPAGTRVPYSAITGLGLKKWDSKGLATVRFEIGGRKGEFLVDDYKFEAEPTREILDTIKRHLEGRQAGK